MKVRFKPSFILSALFIVFVFFVYLHNLARDIYGGDVGDLVTAAYVFGVAHPPGYPLFTFLGFLLSRLPVALPVVSKVGLISVFSSTLALVIFLAFSHKFTKNILISLLSSSIIAFSYLFWLYSELPEVFSLNNFLVILLIFASILFYKEKKPIYIYFVSFLASFNLTNHHTALLVFPSVLILVLYHFRFIFRNKKIFFGALLSFLIGFLPYLYIPIAAFKNPVINWDNAVTIENFLRLIARADYGTFSAGIFQKANIYEEVIVLKKYFLDFISSITFPAFFIGLIGAYNLLRSERRIFLSLFVAFLLSGPVFIFYSGFPLFNTFILGASERFYVLSSVVFAFFIPFGFLSLRNLLLPFFSKREYVYLIISVFFIIPLLLFRHNFLKTDLSKTVLGNTLGENYLKTLPADSVIFLSGDTIVFNTWYVHYVLGERPDVQTAQLGGFANDTYFKKVRESYIEKNKNEKNSGKILFGSMLEIAKKRPVFLSSPLASPFENVTLVPYGLVLQLVLRDEVPDEKTYLSRVSHMWKDINPPKRENLSISERNLTLSDIPTIYANSLVRTGNFIYEQYKNVEEAVNYYSFATRIDPNFSKGYAGLAALQYDVLKKCTDAEKNLKHAIELNALEKNYYLLLFLVYKNCYKDQKAALKFKEEFKKRFDRDIEQEFRIK